MLKDAPPFVRFDYREVGIDQEASAKSGTRIPLVKPLALIMQHGSKDETEKDADEWLESIRQKALTGNYPVEWAQRFKMQFEEFLKGNELPRHGIPIRTWPAPNREQIIRLLAIGITTVEDLAVVPDNGLGNIGLDGRYLRDLARNYIEEAKGTGVIARELADVKSENARLIEEMARMQTSIGALEAAMPRRETIHVAKKG